LIQKSKRVVFALNLCYFLTFCAEKVGFENVIWAWKGSAAG
jgi:hypothetical protein